MSLERLDHSMTVGDESSVEPLLTIFDSCPSLSPEILWTWMSWNASADPSRWKVPCWTGLITTHGRAATLLSAQDRPKRRKAEQMLAAALQLLALLLEEGSPGLAHLPQDEARHPGKRSGKGPCRMG